MEVTNDAMNAVNRYFHTLRNLGYKKDSDVFRLLSLIFIEEMLDGPWSFFVTDEDYSVLNKALYCLYGTSCMIPYPDYRKTHREPVDTVYDDYRISEEGDLRITETDSIRTVL